MLKISADSLRVLCSFLFLWIGHTLATNQSVGRTPESKIWKNNLLHNVLRHVVGPQALLVLSVQKVDVVYQTVIVTLEIDDIGPIELYIGEICDRSSLVKTDLK